MSKGKTLILKENPTEILFDNKTKKKGGKRFLLTTKFSKSTNDASILAPIRGRRIGKQPYTGKGRGQETIRKNTKKTSDAENPCK